MACEEVRQAVSDGDRRVLRGRRVRAHLRDCGGCAAFAAAIPARRAELRALAPPLPPLLAAGLLARVTTNGSMHAAGGSGGSGGIAAAAAGKLAGVSLATKALVGVAVLAGTAADVTGGLTIASHAHRRPDAQRVRHLAPAAPPGPTARPAPGPRGAQRGHVQIKVASSNYPRGVGNPSPKSSAASAKPSSASARAAPSLHSSGRLGHAAGRGNGPAPSHGRAGAGRAGARPQAAGSPPTHRAGGLSPRHAAHRPSMMSGTRSTRTGNSPSRHTDTTSSTPQSGAGSAHRAMPRLGSLSVPRAAAPPTTRRSR